MAKATSRASRRPNPAVHGLPGHPVHPPLTDATIGMFTFAAALAVIGYAGALDSAAGKACWLGLIGGLIVAGPTAATRFARRGALRWGSPPRGAGPDPPAPVGRGGAPLCRAGRAP